MSDTIIGVLIGSAMTFLGLVINNFYTRKNLRLQFENQKQSELEKLKSAKLEELHNLLSIYINVCTSFSAGIQTHKIQPISLSKFQEMFDSLLLQATKSGTLIKLYTPELKEEFNSLLETVTGFYVVGVQIVTEGKPISLMMEKHLEFNSKCMSLLKKLEDKSHEQNRLPSTKNRSSHFLRN